MGVTHSHAARYSLVGTAPHGPQVKHNIAQDLSPRLGKYQETWEISGQTGGKLLGAARRPWGDRQTRRSGPRVARLSHGPQAASRPRPGGGFVPPQIRCPHIAKGIGLCTILANLKPSLWPNP